MQYQVTKLDGRYRYHRLFQYQIAFSDRMAMNQGPLHFATAQMWFFNTYGWSAEVRQYDDIRTYVDKANQWLGNALPMPGCINPQWSWTNGINHQCRIYVATDRELSFFMMAHPRSK
jgi:hypothetical protein